ncbi:MAG: MFS transporter [Candidatus Hodarchaeales archaeon]|jgi:MFS family permease
MESTRSGFSLPYNRTTWIAGIVTLFANIPLLIYGLYVNIYLREDLLTVILLVSFIAGIRNLLQIFLRIPLGELSQIIGRKPLILFGHLSYTIALLLLFLATDWVFVFIGTIFIGLGMSFFWPAIFGYLGDLDTNKVGESMGRIFSSSDIGAIFGSIFAFILLNEFNYSLKNLFGLVGLISLLTGIISYIILPESLAKEDRRKVASVRNALMDTWFSMVRSFTSISRTKRLWEVFFFHFILSFIEFTVGMFIPLMVVSKGFSYGDVSAISLCSMAMIFWLKPYLGKLTDSLDYAIVTTITIMTISVTMMAFLVTDDFISLIVLYIFLNASITVAYFATNGETTRRAPISQRGIALGVFGVYVSLGRTTSTLVLGPVWETLNLEGVFLFAPVLVLFLVIVHFFTLRRAKKESPSSNQTREIG